MTMSHMAHDEQAVGDVSKCDDAVRARARLGGAGSAPPPSVDALAE
jgi:hypothetical protein